ncbi:MULTISPECIES: phage tail tape measure protein [Streptomycetaceae]|uniref:Phage tail tape measure protein, family protein, core region n=1 Tax=Streptantibioticus cattleyicolor (strain ATCC 35852 / DSM 46488 / JCM 4925 / NBRC 14057 / NRRL 8057) TaxID=1003195 RepID=F8JS21_STREN|nr:MULTISPECIES: phage tail tape measure protein [Streptomycetaceae]AEW92930.1 phage tail tape measure protein, family protein, core region [Streptantibioticus cattleyicolor NRRL 8057 = DSM 46488]MYS57678.1 phage tail tape measure protein [Streptomyces sp. SID5468]CCB73290.1 protein of unknown function [Streptantibioticus cattleyicolor NRRL 8057 = DSM 46488]
MPQLPPIGIEFTANAAEALKTLQQLAKTLTTVGEAALLATEGLDTATASLQAAAEPLSAVADASQAAKTGMQGFARATRTVGQAADTAAVATDEAMTTITAAAERMAETVTTSAEATATAMASLDEDATAVGAAFVAGSDEAAAALARLTEAAKVAAASMEKVAATSKTTAGESAASADVLGAKWLGLAPVFEKVAKWGSIGLAGVGIESVRMASKFQTATTQLVTSAGELEQNLDLVRSGLLKMSGQVGVSATDLAKAMYYIEAAGYHAADGLTVVKAAAQGAAAEGADTTTVAKALTDVLVDYHLKASAAADVTSKMITAVAHGKTNLQEFSGAFASIVPAASAAGISFQDVLSALAQMTNHGFTATRASQNLAQALRSLLNPTRPMLDAFKQFGVDADVLKEKLHGPNGLTDAMEYLSQAAAKGGKEGTTEFAAALKRLMGTAPGANAALATVGENYKATAETISAVGKSTTEAGNKVLGFALVQQSLGQQVKQLRAGFDALMIRLGTALIPQVSRFITLLESRGKPVVEGFSKAISGITSGFSGQAPRQQGKRGGQEGQQAPQVSGWERVGQQLRAVANDFTAFGRQAAQAMRNVASAAAPVLAVVGGALLGALRVLGGILANVVGPALKGFSEFLAKNQGLVKTFGEVILGGLAAKLTVIGGIKAATGITSLATNIVRFPVKQIDAVAGAFKGLKEAGTGLMEAGRAIKALATSEQLAAVASRVMAGAQAVLNAVMDANPIVLVVVAIAALVAGLIYAYNHFSWFRNIVDTVFHAVGQAALAVWHTMVTAWNGVIGAVEAVWHAIETAWNAVARVTSTVWNAIVGFFKKWWPLLLVIFAPPIAALLAIWNHFHTEIMAVVHAVWNAVSSFLKVLWDGIKAVASVVWAAIKAVIVEPIQATWHVLQQVWNSVSHWLGGQWQGIKSVASTVWNGIKSAIINPLESAWHTITGTVGRIADTIGHGLQSAWNAVSNIGSKFLSIGANIIDGIVQGVENAAGSLFRSLKNLAGDALKAAKDFLGISSPSRAFAQDVGQWIPAGVGMGVTQNTQAAIHAVRRMAVATLQAGNAAAFGGPAAMATSAGYAGPALGASFGQVNLMPEYPNQPIVHIHVRGSVLAERDLRDTVQTELLRLGARNSQTWPAYRR